MWWVWDDHRREGPFAGAYSARGAIGQYITVFPAMDVVVAHKTVPSASDIGNGISSDTDAHCSRVLRQQLPSVVLRFFSFNADEASTVAAILRTE
jgi:hypothetical protein